MATGSLVFLANISALGFTTYFVKEAAVGGGNAKTHLSTVACLVSFSHDYVSFF